MKTLLLLRHAKSSWSDPGLSDHDRPLNKRGLSAAPRMGRLLAEAAPTPDLILCSTARRAHATVELLVEAAGYTGPVRFTEQLYLAGPDDFVELLSRLPSETACPLVVGHNPGLERLLAALTGDEHELPTAALAHVELNIAAWPEFDLSIPGVLVNLWRPRELE